MTTTVDRFIAAICENGADHLFLNPGTDTAPILEAIAQRDQDGLPSPRVVLCLHEAVALAAAHGYFMATGRPQVVMVHVDVGTQNLGAMLHNAWRGEAGVVIVAGRTPIISFGDVPGMRDLPVHWQQDVPDQDGIARAYAKATIELSSPRLVDQQVGRAFQLARATQSGPVYVTAAREVLMETAPDVPAGPSVQLTPRRFGPDPAAAADAAALLASASRPLLTTTRVGQNPDAVAVFVRIAELLGSPVVDRRERMNFPSTHPLYVRDPAQAGRAMSGADAVAVIDADVPWVPRNVKLAPGTKVLHLGADPIRAGSPNWTFPSNLTVQSDPLLGLLAVESELRDRISSPRVPWFAPDPLPATDGRFDAAAAFQELNTVLAPDDAVVEEVTTSDGAMRVHFDRTIPGSHFQSGGSGLGWALGAAVGVKLAQPTRRVAAVVGDGAFMFGNPAAALWTAARSSAPFLTVLLDNGGYAASRRPVLSLYPDGAYANSPTAFGTAFGEPVDYASLAIASGFAAETAGSATELRDALSRAVAIVDGGRGALVVAKITSPWF